MNQRERVIFTRLIQTDENQRTPCSGLRHLFAISDVRNVAHVSDDERAEQELAIIEAVGGEEIRGVL